MSINFDSQDRRTLIWLTIGLVVFVTAFFVFVWILGLISYPSQRIEGALKSDSFDYFAYSLEYRERRLALALTYRTYITSFGLIVGLVLSTIGGLFVLRKAVASFTAGGEAELAAGSKPWSFSLGTNSPGIIFMLAGVSVMIFTQFFAIPVGAPEIFPTAADVRCHPSQLDNGSCYLGRSGGKATVEDLLAYCDGENRPAEDTELCEGIDDLLESLKP